MWKNTAEPGRPQITRRLTRISRRIPKATNAHSEYVILIAFPLQQWLQWKCNVYHHGSTIYYRQACDALFAVLLQTKGQRVIATG